MSSLNGDLQDRQFNCRFRASPCHPSTWLYTVFQSNTLLDYRWILDAISACIQTDCATKREILRETASVYDPFGFLSPVVLHAKLILQALCRILVHWDEPFEPKKGEEWRKWATSLLDANKFFIPRCVNPEMVRSRRVGIHVFADASVSAFGAIAYLCFNHTDGVKIAFIMAKTR